MSLLRDIDLVAELHNNPGFVAGLPKLTPENLYSAESPIQPSSIDLHIGQILIPADSANRPFKQKNRGDHVLKPGNTAVIETFETLDLPKYIAAIGFPPSHISIKGLLMTNPGHVDPGYQGRLHLTVINMSRSDIVLRCKDIILTAVFYKLEGECKVGYNERREQKVSESSVNLLSPDFLDITKRAQKISNIAVAKSALLAGVIALVITVLSQVLPFYLDTKKEIAVTQEDVKNMQDKISSLEIKIGELEKSQKK